MSLKDSKSVYETTIREQNVDSETGELLSEKTTSTVVKTVKYSEFIQVYLDDLTKLLNINKISVIKVLMCIWQRCESKGNEHGNTIHLIKSDKLKISNDTGLSLGTVNNCVAELNNRGILVKKDRGVYILNPQYFFKGSLKDRVKAVQLVVEYKIQEKENKKK